MAATFRRNLTITHPVLGGRFKDAPVSPVYTDVFDSNMTVFGDTGFDVGRIPLGSSINAVDYLLEFPVLETPKFGAGDLSGLELNLYFSDLNYEADYHTTKVKIFKIKDGVSFTDSNFGSFQNDNLFFASANVNNTIFEVENFEQITSTTGGVASTGTRQFMNAVAAYDKLSWLDKNLRSEDSFLDTFAEDYLGEEVVFVENSTSTHIMLPLLHTWERGDPTDLTLSDLTAEVAHVDTVKKSKYLKLSFSWPLRDVQLLIRTDGNFIDIAASLDARITTNNSFFDLVKYTPAHATGKQDDGSSQYTATSFPQVEKHSGSNALAMTCHWEKELTKADGAPLSFGRAVQNYQTIMLMKRLPHPSYLIREKGNSSFHKDALEINIRLQITEMPIMERWSGSAGGQGGLHATRGFFITFSTRPPDDSESFSTYLSNHEEQTGFRNPKIGDDGSDIMENNLFGLGIINGSSHMHIPTGNNSGTGQPMVIAMGGPKQGAAGGYNTELFIRGRLSSHGGPENEDETPYFPVGIGRSRSRPLGDMSKISDDNPPPHSPFVPTWGTWMNLKIIISPDRNKLAYIITDDEDKIWWSYKERRAGVQQTSRALESKPKKEGFPSYMCFWLNNRKIGFGRAEETEGYYLSTTVNATSTVLIDNITITNVSCDINNATNSKYNISDRSPVVISSKGGVTHIETDNLTSNTVDTDSEGTDFGSTQGLYGKNIYESFGLKHDDGDSDIDDPEAFGITPTYLIFGTTSSDAWEDQDVNLFLGGFSSENAEYSDYTDVNKHMDINVTAGDDGYSSDLLLYASRGTGGPNLGDWITAIHGERLNTNTSPLFRLRTSVTNAAMEVRYFTRKGFIRFHEGDINASDTFTRRECPFLAAKIVNIDNVSSGEITVSNVKGLLGTADEQYIIYRQGQAWADVLAVAKKGITLIEQPDGNILRFDSYLAFADSGAELCVDKYLDELYISPYRYWMVMEIYNVSSGLNKILPDFSYTHALLMDNSVVPSATVKGFTFNEFLYSDAPFKPNAWSLMISTNSILETEIDYGFGSMDSDGVGEGYLNSKAVIETGFTTFDISGLVRVEGRRRILDIDANKKITLFITPELQSTSANLKLSTTKAFASPVKPYLTFVYTDESPTVEDFKVQPNEDDPFYAQYTWTCKDDDLWYGFMILDETAIKHQYHSAVAHMPFSEKDIETDGSKTYLYRYNDLYNGAAVAGNVGATTGTGSISNTIEGLSGYALDFTESAVGLMRNIYWDDGDYTDPTSHASFVAHVVVNSTTAKHYIVSKREQFEIYIDSGGKVNAKLYYSSSASVNLQSFSVVPEDGETPINIILTFDVGLAVGNCKLFINGKLEDQSGEKTTDGSTHNWKINSLLSDTAARLVIGMQNALGTPGGIPPSTYTNRFHGLIEEVVIYNKTIYPVVPQTGELTIYKQPEELTVADIAAGKTIVAKLFIKDYHNIRGTSAGEVASTSMVAYRKSGVGLKTN